MGSHTWIFSKIQVLHPRLQLQLSTLWAFSSSEELQPTMREPATSWQQEQCSGKRDRLFLSICGNHVLSPSLPPASLPSTSTTSVSLTLPLTAQQSEEGGWRRCLQLVEGMPHHMSTRWRSWWKWRRAPPGERPTASWEEVYLEQRHFLRSFFAQPKVAYTS